MSNYRESTPGRTAASPTRATRTRTTKRRSSRHGTRGRGRGSGIWSGTRVRAPSSMSWPGAPKTVAGGMGDDKARREHRCTIGACAPTRRTMTSRRSRAGRRLERAHVLPPSQSLDSRRPLCSTRRARLPCPRPRSRASRTRRGRLGAITLSRRRTRMRTLRRPLSNGNGRRGGIAECGRAWARSRGRGGGMGARAGLGRVGRSGGRLWGDSDDHLEISLDDGIALGHGHLLLTQLSRLICCMLNGLYGLLLSTSDVSGLASYPSYPQTCQTSTAHLSRPYYTALLQSLPRLPSSLPPSLLYRPLYA